MQDISLMINLPPILNLIPRVRTSREHSRAWRSSKGSTRPFSRWSSVFSTSVSSPTPSTDPTTRTPSPSWCYSQMIWWDLASFGRHTKTWLQVAIDCKSTGLPSHENPYAMDFQVSSSLFGNLLTLFALQESAVTCCEYVVDCPPDVRQCSDKLFIHVQLQSLDYSLPLCCRVKRKEVLRLVFKVSWAHWLSFSSCLPKIPGS